MIIRYSDVLDTLFLYYYNDEGKVVKEDLEFNEYHHVNYTSLSEVRSVLTNSPYLLGNIIHDDGEE